MITRSQVAGALKLLNANNVTNRRGQIQNMLAAEEYSAKDVAKVMGDIESYPEWAARVDLDSAPAGDPAADPAVIAPKRKKK